jgi:hypothetical protein
MWGNKPETANPYPPAKQAATPSVKGYLAQGDHTVWNPEKGAWENPDGSFTKGSGPTWVNPNGLREDNYELDIRPSARTVTNENQIKSQWRADPEAPKYGPTTA